MAITDYTESERKAELLASLLCIKENGSYHSTGSDGKILYTLLFTTYQKMIAQDQQNFFYPNNSNLLSPPLYKIPLIFINLLNKARSNNYWKT